jgi:putative acetyltransferase
MIGTLMNEEGTYPTAIDPALVGTYAAQAKAGGGYVWDAVLEYRVWVPGEADDSYRAFATYPGALAYSKTTPGAEDPLALVRQEEYIDEPEPGQYVHVTAVRVTEWPVEFLSRPRRTSSTIPVGGAG